MDEVIELILCLISAIIILSILYFINHVVLDFEKSFKYWEHKQKNDFKWL